ncbi:MAG: hypothetical protein K2K93_11360, partial [Muribaculaceae bacterium]|nr:hypothetical protein [Muribaculaceae bacterium]
ITSNGKIKLLDFGIAKQLDPDAVPEHQKTTAGVFMGKAGYAAPELVLGDVSNQNETPTSTLSASCCFSSLQDIFPLKERPTT